MAGCYVRIDLNGEAMNSIFLNYAAEDRSTVELLAKIFKKNGWSVLWANITDKAGLHNQENRQAMTSAKCMVVVWSKRSIRSDWVIFRATYGKRNKILVPILIDKVKICDPFVSINAADLSDWKPGNPHPEVDKLLKDIERTIESGQRPGTVPVLGKWRIELVRKEREYRKFLMYLTQERHTIEHYSRGLIFLPRSETIYVDDRKLDCKISTRKKIKKLNLKLPMERRDEELN